MSAPELPPIRVLTEYAERGDRNLRYAQQIWAAFQQSGADAAVEQLGALVGSVGSQRHLLIAGLLTHFFETGQAGAAESGTPPQTAPVLYPNEPAAREAARTTLSKHGISLPDDLEPMRVKLPHLDHDHEVTMLYYIGEPIESEPTPEVTHVYSEQARIGVVVAQGDPHPAVAGRWVDAGYKDKDGSAWPSLAEHREGSIPRAVCGGTRLAFRPEMNVVFHYGSTFFEHLPGPEVERACFTLVLPPGSQLHPGSTA